MLCQTCGKRLTVQHLLVYCKNHMVTRKSLGIPNNHFETLSLIENNIKKLITFL